MGYDPIGLLAQGHLPHPGLLIPVLGIGTMALSGGNHLHSCLTAADSHRFPVHRTALIRYVYIKRIAEKKDEVNGVGLGRRVK